VVAAGAWTPVLLRDVELYVPMYPLKGYDLIVPLEDGEERRKEHAPQRIVADASMFLTRFHDSVRITSIGEFSGWHTRPNNTVLHNLREKAQRWLPSLSNRIMGNNTRVVTGLRPFVADGRMIIGRAPQFENLFLNTGPGSNGWKLCVGAARVLVSNMRHGDGDRNNGKSIPDDMRVPREALDLVDPRGRVLHAPVFCAVASAFSSEGYVMAAVERS